MEPLHRYHQTFLDRPIDAPIKLTYPHRRRTVNVAAVVVLLVIGAAIAWLLLGGL